MNNYRLFNANNNGNYKILDNKFLKMEFNLDLKRLKTLAIKDFNK